MQMIAETQSMQRDLMKCVNDVLLTRNTIDRPEMTSVSRGSLTPVACDDPSAIQCGNTTQRAEKTAATKSSSSPVTCEFSPGALPCRQVVRTARPTDAEANWHEKVTDTIRQVPPPPPPPGHLSKQSQLQPHLTDVHERKKPAPCLQSSLLNEISDATADIPAFLANARQRRSP